MIRKLRVYPDPILHQISEPVVTFDEELKSLVADMLHTMKAANGIGLSAVQIGVLKRVVVLGADEENLALVNPKIVMVSGQQNQNEGCLSVPGVFEDRERHRHVKVQYQTLKGERAVHEFFGLAAFCVQHELEHLDGKIFIDDFSPLKKNRSRDKIRKAIKRFHRDPIKQQAY